MNTRAPPVAGALLAALLALLGAHSAADATTAARLLRVPLTRETTPGAGQLGEPVMSYYTTVGVGTPSKPFKLQFDVGFSGTFLPHYEWSPFKVNLHYGIGYRCKDSSSCSKVDRNYELDYQHCRLTGKLYDDVWLLAGQPAATHNASSASTRGQRAVQLRQNFIAASDATDGRFKPLPVDGFVGLSATSQGPSTRNLLTSLVNANLLDNLQFSLWFNPVLDSAQGGELVLGGQDPMRYSGQLYFHSLAGPAGGDQWALNLQHVGVGQLLVSCNNMRCQAVISSGVNAIYGPSSEVKKIYDLLNTSTDGGGGQPNRLQLLDCRRIQSLPTLSFTIDGIVYALLPSNYVRRTRDGSLFKRETCYVNIMAADGPVPNQWVLGTSFLEAYYSFYDLTHRQVAFGTAR